MTQPSREKEDEHDVNPMMTSLSCHYITLSPNSFLNPSYLSYIKHLIQIHVYKEHSECSNLLT